MCVCVCVCELQLRAGRATCGVCALAGRLSTLEDLATAVRAESFVAALRGTGLAATTVAEAIDIQWVYTSFSQLSTAGVNDPVFFEVVRVLAAGVSAAHSARTCAAGISVTHTRVSVDCGVQTLLQPQRQPSFMR